MFGILQSLLILLFFTLKKGAIEQHKYFAGICLITFLLQLDAFLQHSGFMLKALYLMNVLTPLVLLLGPFSFLYTKSLLVKTLKFQSVWPHFLPFFLFFSYSFFFFLAPWERKYNAFISAFSPSQDLLPLDVTYFTDPLHIQGWIVVEGIVVHLMVYSLLGFFMIFRQPPTKETRNWLVFLNIMLLSGAIILFGAEGGIINGKPFFPRLLPEYASKLFGTIFTYGLTAFLLSKAVLAVEHKKKYYNSTIKKALKISKLEKIVRLMEQEKVYLHSDFSRKKLAELSNISPNHLSQILNEELQISFFDWVNEYRIEEGARRLGDPNGVDKMETLAYELGYKSKSTFFTNFKKRMGMTPLQFRKSQLLSEKVFS